MTFIQNQMSDTDLDRSRSRSSLDNSFSRIHLQKSLDPLNNKDGGQSTIPSLRIQERKQSSPNFKQKRISKIPRRGADKRKISPSVRFKEGPAESIHDSNSQRSKDQLSQGDFSDQEVFHENTKDNKKEHQIEFDRFKTKIITNHVASEKTSEINIQEQQQPEKAKEKEKKGLKFELDYEK